MAIELDKISDGTDAGSVELTVAHTVDSVAGGGILIVTIQVTDSGIDDRTIGTVTHNGEACTHIPGADSDAYSEERTEIWYRLNPTTGGTPNIVVTPGGSCTDLSLGAISLKGVGTAPAFVTQTASGDETPPTLDIATEGAESWVIDSVASQEPGGKLVPAHNDIHNTDVGGDEHCAQYVDAGGAGSQTMNYTDPDSDTHWAMSAVSVQFQNSPTVALGTPNDQATGVSLTPGLTFTGTDGESDEVEYQVQVDTVNTFDSQSGNNIDSYSESNQSGVFALRSDSPTSDERGQSFNAGAGGTINEIVLYLRKVGLPTGNMVVHIYAHTGVYGTSSLPTGSILATSDAVDASTLSTDFGLITFSFSGDDKIELEFNTPYCFIFNVSSSDSDASNTIQYGLDDSSPTHAGNLITESVSDKNWGYLTSRDTCFYVSLDNIPLLSKNSSVPDATFSGTGDPHPWPSGNEITYTVQAGDALTASTAYYWRVRAKDPDGSNAFGAWSPGDSALGYDEFETTSGATRRVFVTHF